jgi:hypothetical protein
MRFTYPNINLVLIIFWEVDNHYQPIAKSLFYT